MPEHYRIKKVLADTFKPEDGEPFAAGWGPEGWTIWCRTSITLSGSVTKLKKKPGRPKKKPGRPRKLSSK